MLTDLKDNFGKILIDFLPEGHGLRADQVRDLLEVPKSLDHGHLALPVFQLAKSLRRAPPQISGEIVNRIESQRPLGVQSAQAAGGYVNLTLENAFVQESLRENLIQKSSRIGYSNWGTGKTLVIDYSSPNVAKPMSIGHLRATVIGQAIRNLAETQGYRVIGVNHLGDWGVQFGKLAWAFINWGSEYDFTKAPFDSLFKLYVRFHDEAEKNPELDKNGGDYFRRLENGDPEIEKIWKKFIEITLAEHQKIYDLLNVKFDLIQGESFYNDKMEDVIHRTRRAGILEESQGAQVVFWDAEKPPCIIVKSDGTSIYATRDLAGAIYRREQLKGDEILYVVGVDQTLHFQQVFGVLKKLGYEWAANCHHIAFGMYRFKDAGKMSTRRGNVIFMEDVLEKAMEIVSQVIDEKNPGLENKSDVVRQVGVGAVIFNDLINDRIKNVDFDWERALDFEGDSGPYVQYVQVRCKSLRRKFGQPITGFSNVRLESREERALIRELLSYPEVLTAAYKSYRPSVVAQYLLEVCRAFNHFYQNNRVLGVEPQLEMARMTLVQATEKVIVEGLKVLGMEAPEYM